MINFTFSNIQLSFEEKSILSNCSESFSSGDRVLIFGDNGIGKTTLLKILSGHLKSYSGEVKLNNADILNTSFEVLKKDLLFVSSDENTLYPRLTGLENIEYFSKLLNLNTKSRVEKWSKLPLFKEALDTPFHQCSQGMRRVLSLFVMTMTSPKVLLMDECFKSFSPTNREAVYKVISEELDSSVLIFTSHHNESFSFISNLKTFKLNGELIAN